MPHDYKKLEYWLKNRKYCYAYWFRFLQIAAIEKKRKVDWRGCKIAQRKNYDA